MKSAHDISQITVEIQTIDDQVESLRKQQSSLLERRLRLCTELNAVQSITCSMPAEILSHIIYTLVRSIITHRTITPTLFRVGAVCTHWRRTVWTSPQLWTEIHLGWRSKAPSADMIPLIHLFYENSRSLPINLILFSSHWDPTAEQAEELMKVVSKHGKRLRSLLITSLNPTFSDSFIQFACTELPLLETVKVTWDHCPDHEDSRSLFCHAPRLSSLRLELPDIIFMDNPFSLIIPSNQLTKLQLRSFNPTHALYMLSLCHRLVEFDYSCEFIPTGLPNRFEALDLPITLTRLERLGWDILETLSREEVDGLLLKSFVFPSLQELTWGSVIDDMVIEDNQLFLACLENSLKVLNCYHAQRWEAFQVWRKFDHVSELSLTIDQRFSPGFKYSDGVDTLECLTIEPNVSKTNFLPRLRSLHIFFDFLQTPAGSDDDDGGEFHVSLECAIICLLYSRRRAAIDLDCIVDDFISLDFDPSSDHWQRHQRVEIFSFGVAYGALDDGRKFDSDDFNDLLCEFEEVTRDARVKWTFQSLFDIVW